MFHVIDAWLLRMLTIFAHWFQITFGRTNYFLAKVCILINSTIPTLPVIDIWFPNLTGEDLDFISTIIYVCVGTCALMLNWMFIVQLDEANNRAEEGIVRQSPYIEGVRQGIVNNYLIRFGLCMIGIGYFLIEIRNYNNQAVWGTTTVGDIFSTTSLFWQGLAFYFISIKPLRPEELPIKIPEGVRVGNR